MAAAAADGLASREPSSGQAPVSSGSLKARAFPIAVALGLTFFAGVLTDVVAASQILALGGPNILLWLFPVSGLAFGATTILLVPVIDKWARLPMTRNVNLGFSAVLVACLLVLWVSLTWWPESAVPLMMLSLIWIMAALQNHLIPSLLWSLAADIFIVKESKEINGWIASWTYVGRVVALAVTVVTPPLLAAAGIALPWLLLIGPVLTVFIALWLPRRLRGAGAGVGLVRAESLKQSLTSGWSFVREVKVWWWLVIGTVFTFSAGSAMSLGIAAASKLIIGSDTGRLQSYLGGIQLLAVLICILVQRFVAVRLTTRFGINGTLLVLPFSVVFSAILLGTSLVTSNLWVLAGAALLWRVPSWSVDNNARTAALGFVPDQRRARVALILSLATYAVTWVLAGPIAAPGLLSGQPWLLGAIPAIVGALGFVWWAKVYRHWDDSMLHWRLRRRKHGSVLDSLIEDG
jgi:hypothetical protein